MKLNKKHILIGITAAAIVGAVTVFAAIKTVKDTKVTDEEVARYREMIGDSMDEKRAVFVLFNTEDECRQFITEHGDDERPQDAGVGISPKTEAAGYNIVGKEALETVFDTLSDGEYSKEPVQFAGKFCYLKRIGINKPVTDDETIRQIIKEDKQGRGVAE